MIESLLSPAESRRFGLPIYRVSTQTATLSHDLIDGLDSLAHGMVVLRTPAGSQTQSQLQKVGVHSRYADTIVYYDRNPSPLANTNLQAEQTTIRTATQQDATQAAAVATAAFSLYRSHYSASPHVFPEDQVRAGYAEWATSLLLASLTAENSPCYVSVDRGSNEVNGFIATQLRTDGKLDIVLNAVSPHAQGKGTYTSLLRSVADDAAHADIPLTVSTQAWNLKVQRVWVRAGFLPGSAHETFHIPRGDIL